MHKAILKLLIDLAMLIVYLMLMFADGRAAFFTKLSESE